MLLLSLEYHYYIAIHVAVGLVAASGILRPRVQSCCLACSYDLAVPMWLPCMLALLFGRFLDLLGTVF